MESLGIKINKHFLHEICKKRKKAWFVDAAIDWFLIIGCFILCHIFMNPITILASILIIGNRQHALALLGHDGTHYTLSSNKNINDFITNFFSFWPLGITVSGYRSLHYTHHKHTGTKDDPELAHKKSRAPQWNLPVKPARILKYALFDLVGGSIHDYIIIVTYSKPANRSSLVPLILLHAIFLAISLLSGFWWVALIWYLCLCTSFMMFFRLRLWLEHQGTSDTHRLHLTPIQAVLLAPHNTWLHWEHHHFPMVPYDKLPLLRQQISDIPVLKLGDLISFFEKSPSIASGTALKNP